MRYMNQVGEKRKLQVYEKHEYRIPGPASIDHLVLITNVIPPNQHLWGENECDNSYIPTQTTEEGFSTIAMLTAQFTCGLTSALMICKQRKSMVIDDTDCPN